MLVQKWEQVVEVRLELYNVVFSSVENASSLLGLDAMHGCGVFTLKVLQMWKLGSVPTSAQAGKTLGFVMTPRFNNYNPNCSVYVRQLWIVVTHNI